MFVVVCGEKVVVVVDVLVVKGMGLGGRKMTTSFGSN